MMNSASYAIGDSVKRIEEGRTHVGAVVRNVDTSDDGAFYFLEYEEGGNGWWPESSLEAA